LPIVMRFKTYSEPLELSEVAQSYVETASTDPMFKPWLTWAREETEVVAIDEAGVDRH